MSIEEERLTHKIELDTRYKHSIIVDAHKNGFGKATTSLTEFVEREKIVLTSQSKDHLVEILKKLNERLVEGKDFVFYRPMEDVCSTYANLWETDDNGKRVRPIDVDATGLIRKISELRSLGKSMESIHKEDLACPDLQCPYETQKKKVMPIEKGGEGITRIVCSLEMFLTRRFSKNANTIIIDEADGLLNKQQDEVEDVSFIRPFISNEGYELTKSDRAKFAELIQSPNMVSYGVTRLLGFPIKNPDRVKNAVENFLSIYQQKVSNDEEITEKERAIIGKFLLLDSLVHDGVLTTHSRIKKEDVKEPWHHKDTFDKKEMIFRVPKLFQLYYALSQSPHFLYKGELPQVIITMARIRKNALRKEDYDNVIFLLFQKLLVKKSYGRYYRKLWQFYPKYLGEQNDLPNLPFPIDVIRPNFLISISRFRKFFNKSQWFIDAPKQFLLMHEIFSKIATKHKNSKGLVIIFEQFLKWFYAVRAMAKRNPNKLKDDLIKGGNPEATVDQLIKLLTSRLYSEFIDSRNKVVPPLLRFKPFGNETAGTEMHKNEAFLIVFGNWYSGENELDPDYEFANSGNYYSITPRKDLKAPIKEALQKRWARDYLEYPMRSRRDKPTYCITHYFKDTDIELEAITLEILDDYDISLNFVKLRDF
jgi:hypothetical protein